ncbi:uncharacterized protein LOC135116315 isoform X2 [Scylla paramamosain]|uniref:uncharacterized protein LOC135116315 isoform X2 n=1 Tax=Scylla paramamosain TaxID=85552 RepID=UPI0030829D74
MVVMTSCCCCFSPRTGTMGVGVVCLIVGFCASVGFCFALINIESVKETLDASYSEYQNLLSLNLTEQRLMIVESVIGIKDFINWHQVAATAVADSGGGTLWIPSGRGGDPLRVWQRRPDVIPRRSVHRGGADQHCGIRVSRILVAVSLRPLPGAEERREHSGRTPRPALPPHVSCGPHEVLNARGQGFFWWWW